MEKDELDAIPGELKEKDNWVCWKWEERDGASGQVDGKEPF